MEEINNRRMKQQSCTHFSTSSSLAIHKDSKTVSKISTNKPKIRIIHIFAPEIIKTDVANFRELVQRLTGKPTEKDQCRKKIIKPKNITTNNIPKKPSPSSSSSLDDDQDYSRNDLASFPNKPMSDYLKSSGFHGIDYITRSDQRIKEEEAEVDQGHGMWDISGISENNVSTGGFLEGFIGFEELGDEFPNLLPNLDASHVMQFGFGGPQLV